MTKKEAIRILKRHSLNTEACTNDVIAALKIATQILEAQSKPIMDEGLNGEPYVMLGNNSNRDVSDEEIDNMFPCELGDIVVMEKGLSYEQILLSNYHKRMGAKELHKLLTNK